MRRGAIASVAPAWWYAGAVVLLALFYLVTAPTVRSEADDAYNYLYQIEEADLAEAIAPAHVLYIPFYQGVARLADVVGVADDAAPVASVLGAFFAATAVLLAYVVLRRRLAVGAGPAVVGAATLAVSYVFWRYATEVEVYALSLAVGLGLLYAALTDRDELPRWALLGAAGAGALLVHVLLGFLAGFAIPIGLAARRRYRQLAVFAAAFVTLAVVTTYGAYQIADDGSQTYLEFYQEGGDVSVGPSLLVRGGAGAGQAVVASNFLFAYDEFADAVQRAAPDRGIEDEVYFGERVGEVPRGVMTVTFLAAVVAFLAALVLAAPRLAPLWRNAAVLTLIAWLGGHSLFFLLRAGGSDGPEGWVFALPPLLMLVTVGLAARPARRRGGVAPVALVLVAVLGMHNLLGMALLEDETRDRNLAKAAWYVASTTEDDAIITADGTLFFRYLRYAAPAETEYLLTASLSGTIDTLPDRLENGTGRVYATGDVFAVPEKLEENHPDAYSELVEFAADVAPRFRLVADDPFGGDWVHDAP
jgi:hypothetical protein